MNNVAFIDLEVNVESNKVLDYGVVTSTTSYHGGDSLKFKQIINKYEFLCGHNIINHDSKYIEKLFLVKKFNYIDTLTISPIIYPTDIHHKLLKDDKLNNDDINNPLNDAKNSEKLFYKELNAFSAMPNEFKNIMGTLLNKSPYFSGFFRFVQWKRLINLAQEIKIFLKDKICSDCNFDDLIVNNPVELAYVIALINIDDRTQNFAPWVINQFPEVNNVLKRLRLCHCHSCEYCENKFSLTKRLEDIFGYQSFRLYNGEPLQEKAAQAALDGKSLLAVFPTGGGKSITFQLPAIIMGEMCKDLTIIISPLQSLMKDQVDSLNNKNISDAVTINGMLNPIERKEAMERVLYKGASLLYVSPELLRNKSILRIIRARNICRIVIDEAHCFSTWGQDFRVDYLFVADFIKLIMKEKELSKPIPVSCFTATAKQKVIADIKAYFSERLGINLELFATSSERKNLRYRVEPKKNDEEKYGSLRKLLQETKCPTIIYVSRTKKTEELAQKLNQDGFKAKAFNGKMEKQTKIENQEKFINDEVDIMVATSAFGMGVDKSNVKLVVHYEISDSLENYVQEAGRAGRDQNIDAECVIYFNEDDLDKHFSLLNQSKLNMKDISTIWKAIKKMTPNRDSFSASALEIARQAGWDDSISDIETRVKTAISVLENRGYVERHFNCPRVFATSIRVKSFKEAYEIITEKCSFDEIQIERAKRIINSLISSKHTYKMKNADAESRIDYLADNLGIGKFEIIEIINKFVEVGILADHNDLNTNIKSSEIEKLRNENKRYYALEKYLLEYIERNGSHIEVNLKELNDGAFKNGVKKTTTKNIRSLLLFWELTGFIKKNLKKNDKVFEIELAINIQEIKKLIDKRNHISSFVFEYLCDESVKVENGYVNFTLQYLFEEYNNRIALYDYQGEVSIKDFETAILYLSKLGILRIDGGFLVLYNAMQIKRVILDNKVQFKKEDYNLLKEHYKLKVEQIHMVGEFANMMINDYNQALLYIKDYFELEYSGFIKKYFKGNRRGQIQKNITPKKYDKLFGDLSEPQKAIIDDDEHKYLCVLAGPGSGKTRVLVHKLASLLLLEDVKTEQLLMLTFSRAAANEFKDRLVKLIGNTAHYVDIKTFHSYCFDILGRVGDEQDFQDVVMEATNAIKNDEIEESKITKLVLVIDEAQDIGENEFKLINALIDANPEMKVIAVGDDDQNIYEFRGSDSNYLNLLTKRENSKVYNLIDNYRSVGAIVRFTNDYCKSIKNRMKTKPINFVRNEYGKVTVIEYSNPYYERNIIDMISRDKASKKIAILTETNEQAFIIQSLLVKKNINSKLIQSDDTIELIDLYEFRCFIKYLDKKRVSPIISEELWFESKEEIYKQFTTSKTLEIVKRAICLFEEKYSEKYFSDLKMFLKETRFEDLYDYDNNSVIVSTLHKSKGHEFDTVHIFLNNKSFSHNKDKRALYVGMTRAKNYLYIHTNKDFLKKHSYYCEYVKNENVFEEIDEKIIPLTHRDIYLGDFKNGKKTKMLLDFRSGNRLIFTGDTFYHGITHEKICKASLKMITDYSCEINKGYKVFKSEINYMVTWLDKEDIDNPIRRLIVLPIIYLKKIDKKPGLKSLNDNEIDKSFLRNELKKCRIILTKKYGLGAAFMVFNDETLEILLEKLPRTNLELENIRGFGQLKIEKYGKEILDCINNYLNNYE